MGNACTGLCFRHVHRDMENRQDLSSRLDEAMDIIGASESMRRLHRHAATTVEILKTVALNLDVVHDDDMLCYQYQCGSSYEGTVTPDTASDVDVIVALSVPSVVTHHLRAGSGLRLLMFRDDWTRPGYVKLLALMDGKPLTGPLADEHRNRRIGMDQRGRACMKHFQGDNMHGPADALITEDGKHVRDYVPARKCNAIPPFAVEWIRRRRRQDWPSEQQLDRMRTMGCMMVGVGFYNSPEKDIEWRLSFSLQERMLMESLSIYQHKVYILLKLIKKNILEKEVHEDSLSSYHCKTCVFYMAELIPARMWTRDNLIDRLLECLGLLLKWLRNRFCPSYFIEEQNLFEKEGFEILIEPLQRSVDMILQTGHQFLNMLRSDCVDEILRRRGCKLYRLLSDMKVNRYILIIKCRVIDSIVTTYRDILRASNLNHGALQFLTAQLGTIQSRERVSSHTAKDTKAALSHIPPWLHLHIGLEFACRAVTCSTRSDGKELMKKVDSHFRQARNTDFANVRLAQASILFRLGKLEKCFKLLREMEAVWSFQVISVCTCKDGSYTLASARELHDYYPPMRDISATELLRNYVASCVVFLPSQSELVPPPLQYEMFRSIGSQSGSRDEILDVWFNLVVVDAKVYLHFMQYLVCSELDREPHKHIAIDNLVSLTQDDNYDLGHRETAYNLLGWIYLQENRTVDAIQCFIRSWQIRPHHNAAKFHMLNEYRKLVEEQSQDQGDHP